MWWCQNRSINCDKCLRRGEGRGGEKYSEEKIESENEVLCVRTAVHPTIFAYRRKHTWPARFYQNTRCITIHTRGLTNTFLRVHTCVRWCTYTMSDCGRVAEGRDVFETQAGNNTSLFRFRRTFSLVHSPEMRNGNACGISKLKKRRTVHGRVRYK